MNSSRGFGVLLLISLMPLALAAGLFVFTSFAFLTRDLGTLNLCRARQLETQNRVGRSLAKLLKLNPKAQRLRLAQARAEKSLAMAIESANPIAIAAAEAYLLKVQMQRQALAIQQNTLITGANTTLSTGGSQLRSQLQYEWSRETRALNSWLQGSLQVAHSQIPTLAVLPDFLDVAPVYELAPNFEEAQSWSQSWNLELSTVSWARKFFNFHGRFQRSCATSLYSQNDEWIAKLKKVKSSLKAFF
ncbi:hypothetical protein [Bdellovibrio sp. HCB337]|uniref:hypothetical protein n=1 Tax=Bdellovibrio sp. HCB337 TaxID=3394358 RepID=UPI0039A68EC7